MLNPECFSGLQTPFVFQSILEQTWNRGTFKMKIKNQNIDSWAIVKSYGSLGKLVIFKERQVNISEAACQDDFIKASSDLLWSCLR